MNFVKIVWVTAIDSILSVDNSVSIRTQVVRIMVIDYFKQRFVASLVVFTLHTILRWVVIPFHEGVVIFLVLPFVIVWVKYVIIL